MCFKMLPVWASKSSGLRADAKVRWANFAPSGGRYAGIVHSSQALQTGYMKPLGLKTEFHTRPGVDRNLAFNQRIRRTLFECASAHRTRLYTRDGEGDDFINNVIHRRICLTHDGCLDLAKHTFSASSERR